MQTFRELVYMVMDELKLHSDDSSFTEESVIFLLVKYRAFLLKLRYSDIKKVIPESNYQDICIEVNRVEDSNAISDGSYYLKSKSTIPLLLSFGIKRVYVDDYYKAEIAFITKDRMKYTGYNKYLSNIIYCSVGPDNYLYFKFSNDKFLDTEKIHLYGIFLDCAYASDFLCNNTSELIDRVFPIEDSLVSPLIELTVKELLGAEYRPEDSTNNAFDDLSNLANFLLRNTKSQLAKALEL